MKQRVQYSVQQYYSPFSFYLSFHVDQNQSRLLNVKEAYWISSNSSFIQYCDSNIGLFSIAPPLVIDLPTLR